MVAHRRRLIWLATLLVWVALGAGAVVGVAVAGPIALGWRPLAVLSGSMTPTLRTGDEIIVRPITAVALRVGDVVTFHDPSRGHELVTHRVRDVRVTGTTVHVVTRGDANSGSERWSVRAGGEVGRVAYRIPKLGYVTVAASTPLGRILLVVVPVLLLGAYEIRRVWRPREALKSAAPLSMTG
jgi:signal peptidase I